MSVATFGKGVDADKLIGETAYWDMNLMLAQIRGELPHESVISVISQT